MVSDRLRLVAASFLVLFVELFLIRWTGSNVVYLSFFSNFVLLGSFLGIGIGFLRAHSRVRLFPFAPAALAALVVFVRVFHVEIDRSSGSQLLYFGTYSRSGLPLWATLPIVFGAVGALRAMIAEAAAGASARFEPLRAYRLDILGSLLGIAAFSLLAFLRLPPLAPGLVAALLFAVLLPRRAALLALAPLAVLLVALATEPGRGIS